MIEPHPLTFGVDLGGTSTRVGLYDSSMRLLGSSAFPTRVAAGPQSCVEEMAGVIRAIVCEARVRSDAEILGVGIGSPGPLNLRTGVLGLLPNLPGWDDFPLRDALSAAAGLPVLLESDANAAALAEWKLGAASNTPFDSMAMITLGTGVGSGLILNGKVWHGRFGMGGEVGHATVEPEGLLCGCGSRGCLEMYASANGLLRLAQQAVEAGESSAALRELVEHPGGFTPLHVARLAATDASAQKVFDRLGCYLGIGIANLINTLDLPLIVVGGGVASSWELFSPAMFRSIRNYSVVYRLAEPGQYLDCEPGRIFLCPASLGPAAGLLGAGLLPRLAAQEATIGGLKRPRTHSFLRRWSMTLCKLAALAFFALPCVAARAEIKLPALLTDHAVLQRDGPIHLWGHATPGAKVIAKFHQQTAQAVANAFGQWSLYLKPESAGGPYTLTLSGDGADKTLDDVLVGDVWVASGQSNMEMPLAGFPPTASIKEAEREIAAANNPRLRLMLIDHKSSDFPLNDVKGAWTTCTPETVKHFSAAAYFFGRDIAAREQVPVGLIDSTWGGTPADSWVSMDTLGSHADLLPAFASRATFANLQADLDARIASEKREDDEAKAAGKVPPSHMWHPYETSWLPAGLYNGMIAPLTPMSIKGFLWYQGETNSSHDRAGFYGTLFSALIGDWRTHFAQGNLPFLYVQISSFNSPGEDWGLVREQQRRTLAVADTAMVVTLDIGNPDNVHPADKQTVGARLALAARALAYGEKMPFSGPAYREATPELQADGSTGMRVWFDHAAGLTSRSQTPGGFELAGADHRFQQAEAKVEGQTVLVRSATLTQPRYVRFGWAGVVQDSLYNGAGLPASTFSSEENPVH